MFITKNQTTHHHFEFARIGSFYLDRFLNQGCSLLIFPAIVFILIILFCANVFSQTNQKAYPELELKLSEVSAHLRFLASDELMGRRTGTLGNNVAARYIAEQFRANGLTTLPGADDYFQKVQLQKSTPSKLNQVIFLGDTLRQGQDFVVRQPKAGELNTAIIFVDFGMVDQEKGRDDYAGRNVKNKIVVAKFGTPENTNRRSAFAAGSAKYQAAVEHGALALIELYAGQMPWQRLVYFMSRPRYTIVEKNTAESETEIPHILVNDREQKYLTKISSTKSAISASLFIHEPIQQIFTSPNVMGMIAGSNSNLRHETILLTAHFDHLGAGMRPGISPADTIFNGARDNGMGTVALLSAVKALAEVRPARSVGCIAFTGEELGLLGSRFYGDHPLVPLNQTVFVLNADGGGYTDTSAVTVLGIERSTAQVAIENGCRVFNLGVIANPLTTRDLFNASDNIVFARKGVPTVTFSPGFRTFDEEIRQFYHRPQDEADENFNFQYLLKYCQGFAHSARMIANMPDQPHWQAGDEFEAVSKTLYQNHD
ncbi:MAG: M28 family peptidase [bacterium]